MSPATRKKFPAGPSEGLKRWSLGPLNNTPLEYFTMVAREYGDIAGLRVLNFKTIFINHPDLIEDVLVTNARKYSKGRVLRANRHVFGEGLLTSEGDFWLRQRRLAQPAFHRVRIASYAATMVQYTERLLEGWKSGEERDAHHFLMRVAFFPALPSFQQSLGVLHHRRRVGSDPNAVKGRLRQPPLPQPEVSFAGQQAFAEHMPVRSQDPSFRIHARICDQNFFDQVGMIDENRFEIQDAQARDVTIFTGNHGEIFQGSIIQRSERPSFEPFGRAGGEFLANRGRHLVMLCPHSHGVNAPLVCGPQVSCARSARIRKPPRWMSTVTFANPAAVNLANNEAGATGTKVLLMCTTRCSHAS